MIKLMLPLVFLSAAVAASAQSPERIRAQVLVDDALAAHPQLKVLALHVTPPGSEQNVIIASNIGRIGKPADADDLAVLRSGQPKTERTKTGDMSVELAMRDASGQTIGVIGSTFEYQTGDKVEAVVASAERLRDELAARTPARAWLFERAK